MSIINCIQWRSHGKAVSHAPPPAIGYINAFTYLYSLFIRLKNVLRICAFNSYQFV